VKAVGIKADLGRDAARVRRTVAAMLAGLVCIRPVGDAPVSLICAYAFGV
jgi:hypothetical protein